MAEEQYDGECFVCPHCEHRHDQDDPYGYEYQNDDFQCSNCSKEFEAEVSTSVTYVTRAKEGDDES